MKKVFSTKIKIALSFICILVLGSSGCKKEFLEQQPASPSDDNIWASYQNANLFLNDIYNKTPTDFILFGYDPFDNWSDNQFPTFNWVTSLSSIAPRNYTPTLTFIRDQWRDNYANIRKCNMVIQRAESIPDASADEKRQMIGQAKFFRAYWYSWLVNFFGGVPIIKEPLDRNNGQPLDNERSSYQDCVAFIQKDLEEAAAALPNKWSDAQLGRATKGAALALKSEIELYASKWQDCVNTCNQLFTLNEYALADYNTMFIPAGEINKEVIFQVVYDGKTRGHNAELFLSPRVDPASGIASGWGHVQPTQNLIDEYEFKDGKPLTDPLHNNDPYTGRDNRFYASVLYNGADWRGGKVWTFYDPAINVYSNNFDINFSHQGTQTGYYFHKYIDPTITPSETNWYGRPINGTNAVLLRLGEVYLNFAEAQNELSGPGVDVYKRINELRQRGGLLALADGLSQNEMRTKIRHERRIELAFEGKRYFDLIRWKTAETALSGNLKAMKITGSVGNWKYETVDAFNGKRIFVHGRDYLFPIPSEAIDQNPKLKGKQNPGW